MLIADNDPFLAPVQKVYFGEGDLVAQPGSNAGLYVFKRTVADSYLTVNYTVTPTPNGPSGFAIGGGYGGSTSATFMPGVSELSVNLTLNGSGPLPGSAKMTLNPSSQYTIMGADSNTVAIYDVGGDSKWINVFRRVDPVGNTLNEGGDKGRFVVSRYFSYPTGQPPQTIPPPPPFPDFALGGTARAGLDYTATKQATTVILPPLGSSMTFIDGYEVEIAPLADSVYDAGEWVDFALIPNGQSNVPSSDKGVISVTLPISDTGTPPKPQISITTPDPNASELATSSGMYRILRNDVNLPQSLTINYAFDPTGLTDPATFYDDYTITSSAGGLASSGSITFPAGVAMIEVKLTPVDDSKLENDELAQLKLLSGSNYVVDAVKSKALILIMDKEEKPQIVITNQFVLEATKLKVAKWHDAFQMTANGENVEVKGPTAGTNYDFIDRDDDRFNVWVKDLVKWQQMGTNGPTYQHNKVKISTTNVALFTAYNDDSTEVDLVRYTGGDKGNGWFWSDSQMLVSNEVDDKYNSATYLKADDTAPAGVGLLKNGLVWEISDRTHRIALGGTMKAEYEYLPGKLVQSEKTTKVVNVKVHVIILRVNGAQVVSTAAAGEAIGRANEQFAQVGIRLVPNIEVKDPPTAAQGVDLTVDGLDAFQSVPGGIIDMTPEEKALLGAANLRTAATDDVELYYVNYLSAGSRGRAYWKSGVPDQKYADSAIISAREVTGNGDPFTEAHEIGHVLLDDGSHYTAAHWPANLMQQGDATATDAVTASKRLTEGQGKDALSKRPPLLPPP